MNRFIIEDNPDAIARSLCDQHIVKMPLEEAQMLCTAVWHHNPSFAEFADLYKPVHQKHPCTLWAMETRTNFRYAYKLYCSMLMTYIQLCYVSTTKDMVSGMVQVNIAEH